MISPKKNDFVDIHTHNGSVIPEVFKIKCLMAHLREYPHEYPDLACSVGAHPWYLKEENLLQDLGHVSIVATGENILAIGEIGLDKTKDVDMSLQIRAFEIQAKMAEKLRKPVIVHCVKAWDELLNVRERIDPQMPWLVHGFMGSIELANQLISKGMFLSLWYSFALSSRSTEVIRQLPIDKFLLETDSSDADIKEIYTKVAGDLGLSVDDLRIQMRKYFDAFTPTRCKCHDNE